MPVIEFPPIPAGAAKTGRERPGNFSIIAHIDHVSSQSLLTADEKNTRCIQQFDIAFAAGVFMPEVFGRRAQTGCARRSFVPPAVPIAAGTGR
jgi:hypothetical protein